MHVFHIKGFSGALMFILAVLSAVAILLLLPSAFMMVLWNALVYEGLKGPEINLYQGFLLWGMLLMAFKLIFRPEIRLQYVRQDSTPGSTPKKPQSKNESDDDDQD